MTDFNKCVDLVLDAEGGYVDNAYDSGGKTNMGITLKTLKSYIKTATEDDLKKMTVKEAKNFYKEHFWKESCADICPLPVALLVFDMAVNAGQVTAKKLLQRALGVGADGVIGPKTKDKLEKADVAELVWKFTAERNHYYTMCCISSPSDKESVKEQKHWNATKFLKGWLNRSAKKHLEAMKLGGLK